MAERPLAFCAQMSLAARDGDKTETRRIIKDVPERTTTWTRMREPVSGRDYFLPCRKRRFCGSAGMQTQLIPTAKSPILAFADKGDLLWVREPIYASAPSAESADQWAVYKADDAPTDTAWRWKPQGLPGRYMPKALARTWLEVTRPVRVERLQQITTAGALAEGIATWFHGLTAEQVAAAGQWGRQHPKIKPVAIQLYGALWDSLNADRGYPWDDNPRVQVVAFKRTEPPNG